MHANLLCRLLTGRHLRDGRMSDTVRTARFRMSVPFRQLWPPLRVIRPLRPDALSERRHLPEFRKWHVRVPMP